MMPEWRKAKVQTKGKTRSNTHTHTRPGGAVREPTGDGMLYTHTQREKTLGARHTTTPLIFCLFEPQKMEGIEAEEL